jgi:hypothetical protein
MTRKEAVTAKTKKILGLDNSEPYKRTNIGFLRND